MGLTSDFKKSILLEGVPVAYCLGIVTTVGTPNTVTIAGADPDTSGAHPKPTPPLFRMLFDTMQSIQYKIIRAASSSSSSSSTLEIALSDNASIVFPKETYQYDGTNGGKYSSSSTTSGGTGLGEVILTAAGCDLDSTNFATFENVIDDSELTMFLLAFPNGFSYSSKGLGKPDGWVFMLGKRASDYDRTQANANAVTAITFDSAALSSEFTDEFSTAIKAIPVGDGIRATGTFITVSNVSTDVKVSPPFPTLTDAQITSIAAGKVVIVPAA
jgi:hypothetical protein